MQNTNKSNTKSSWGGFPLGPETETRLENRRGAASLSLASVSTADRSPLDFPGSTLYTTWTAASCKCVTAKDPNRGEASESSWGFYSSQLTPAGSCPVAHTVGPANVVKNPRRWIKQEELFWAHVGRARNSSPASPVEVARRAPHSEAPTGLTAQGAATANTRR